MNLLIFGPQGSGKGTQAEKLSAKYNLAHIETGQIFREIARKKTELGAKILDFNNRKEMIPDQITVQVIESFLSKIPKEQGVILDSAPRTMAQIRPIEEMFAKLGRQIDQAIYISLPYDESVLRITMRYACTLCYQHLVLGKQITSAQDSCPICGGEVRQRGDDTPDGIAKRLETFYALTMPVIEQYRDRGMLLEVDGNQDIDSVFDDIISKLQKKIG